MVSIEAEKLAKKYGYLKSTIERFIASFGLTETEKMLEAYELKPASIIRVNTLKISAQELNEKLSNKGFKLIPSEWYTDGFVVTNEPFSLGGTTEYLSGYYFIQSKASWLPVLLLDPKPNETVIDMAAAPGGKATHIAQLMNNTGTLFCLDISRERIKSLRSNLGRCGIKNVICKRTDAREINDLNLKADKILLDAPCSGEGLMAIDKSRRTTRNEEDISRMADLQKQLFEAALKVLKKDGIIVYSTCSTAPEENEEIIDEMLKQHNLIIEKAELGNFSPGLVSVQNKAYNKDLQKAIRLYPHLHKTEGFFTCKLRYLGES